MPLVAHDLYEHLLQSGLGQLVSTQRQTALSSNPGQLRFGYLQVVHGHLQCGSVSRTLRINPLHPGEGFQDINQVVRRLLVLQLENGSGVALPQLLDV